MAVLFSWGALQASGDSASGSRQDHWAYAPARRETPSVATQGIDFARNAIDVYSLATLRQYDLSPSRQVERRTLIRRLHVDLLGLPPAPDAVDEFLNDSSPNAYEKLVDRLLASPHFGERMAMVWLDLVRYGDTNGYHADVHRHVFPYRDYVINSFNRNKPFDQFTIEQLAGDLLPHATLEQKVASGYNRMNMITTEGGAQEKEYLAKYAADRVRNASAVWLASTVGCAECHDHKFDPFTTRDFYGFAAFFADVQQVGVYPNKVDIDPQLKVPTPSQSAELARLDQRIAALQKILDTATDELTVAQAEWERSLPEAAISWSMLRPIELASQNGTTFTVYEDGSVLAGGNVPDTDVYTLTFSTDLQSITALRIEVLPDDALPGKGPGRAANGNFVLSHLAVETVVTGADQPHSIALQNATASFEQKGGNLSVAGAIDPEKKDAKTGWSVAEQFGKAHHAVFETKEDLVSTAGVTLKLHLHQTHGGNHTLGRFRISATQAARPVTANATKIRGVPDPIAEIALVERGQRSEAQGQALAAHFRSVTSLLESERRERDELKRQYAELDKSIPLTLYTVAVSPPVMRVLPRGNWMDDSGEIVQASVPHFLPQPATAEAAAAECGDKAATPQAHNLDSKDNPRLTRLDLARWLVSHDNPLTARVLVNRLWKMLFGEGLVRTSEDFGTQGAPPTHPELLDWLAIELIESGWDIKHMLRLMVMSGTYRQSSEATAELRRVDPYNQWLARQTRFRLDAEMVRDCALATSGLLTHKLGGRSVKPYQPEGYWDHCNTFQGKLVYDQDHGEDLYRRGLYSYWKRTFLHPAFLAFDAPSREECTSDRPRSNTPLQALVLLNDPTFVEAARVFAERIIREGGDTIESRVQFAYRRALARLPHADELKLMSALVQQHVQAYEAEPIAAADAVRVGEWPIPNDFDTVQLAAWTSVARVILNLHETITRY